MSSIEQDPDNWFEDERLIPDIPGVEHYDYDFDEVGVLADEIDEESDEDVLEKIAQDLKAMLVRYGVGGAANASEEDLIQLWHTMDMSEYLVGDLALFTSTDKQEKLQNRLAVTEMQDLYDRAERLVYAQQVRNQLIDKVAPNLMKLGYGQLDAYRLPRYSNEKRARAFRTEGWLLSLPFTAEVPQQVRAAIMASKERRIPTSAVLAITQGELLRQARILDSNETRADYDHQVSYEAVAYKGLQRSVRNAYRISEFAFAGLILRK